MVKDTKLQLNKIYIKTFTNIYEEIIMNQLRNIFLGKI